MLAGPGYLAWAKERIAEGQARAGRAGEPHLLVCYALYAPADSLQEGRDRVRHSIAEYLGAGGPNPLTRAAGLADEFVERLARDYVRGRISTGQVSDEMVDSLAIAGPPEHCAQLVADLERAGADVVALFPHPQERALEVVQRTSDRLIPLLRAERM